MIEKICYIFQQFITYLTGGNGMSRIAAIVESLCYLLNKLKKADKIHLVKLMYLADKHHLMNYGRTITGDEYFAFPHGPGGSKTMDVLNFKKNVLKDLMPFAMQLLKKGKGFEYLPGENCAIDQLEMLSESDIEALDFALDNFGKIDKWNAVDYTHTLSEWKKFEVLLKSGRTKKEAINIVDVLSPTNDKYFTVSKEHLEESYKIITGTFD
jgi:hypothetical protein